MFRNPLSGWFLLGIIAVVCNCFYSAAVKTGIRTKVEGVRADMVDSHAVMVSVAEPSQKKGSVANVRTKLQQIFKAEIGVRELTGKNDGKRVQEYLHAVKLQGNLSYCSAFVCFCLEKAGITNPKNGWAPALFPQKRLVRGRPQTGDVFGIYFQELKRIGHCGFVDSWDDIWCITVEANTTDIRAGPGQGVFRKKRLVKTIYKVADWVDPLYK